MQTAALWGFKPLKTTKLSKKHKDLCDIAKQKQMTLDDNINCDGLVYKIDQLDGRDQVGATSMYPRGMLAFKFETKLYPTRVIKVRLSLSRYGTLNPIGDLEPVDVGGTITRFISLHNADFVLNNRIGAGTEIFFTRAGGVIPAVKDVVNKDTVIPFSEKDVVCPVCGEAGIKSEVLWQCNNSSCVGKLKCLLYYAASKQCFDIKGLGHSVIESLTSLGIVKSIADLFKLKKSDLDHVSQFGDKTKANLISSIRDSVAHVNDVKILKALSIHRCGGTAIESLVKAYPLDQIHHLSLEEIKAVKGIGPKTAETLHSYFQNSANYRVYCDLMASLNIAGYQKA